MEGKEKLKLYLRLQRLESEIESNRASNELDRNHQQKSEMSPEPWNKAGIVVPP